MSESLDELKAIVDNAPRFAVALSDYGYYVDDDCHAFVNGTWMENSDIGLTRSLSDIKRIIELMEDKLRLDHLQKCNEVFNKRVGSNYGWRVDWNHNRIAVVDTGLSGVSIRRAIDEHIKKVGDL